MTVSSPSQSSPKSSNTRHQTKLRFQLITSIKQFQTTALHNWQVIRAYPDAFSLNEFQLAFPDAIYWISVGISKNKAAIPLLPMQHGKNRNINLAEQLCLSEGWTSSLAQISAADYSPFRQNPIVATFRKGISATATFTDLLSIDGILPCTEGCSRSSLDKAGGARTFAAGTTGAWNSGIHSISISSWSNSRRNGSSSSMINLVFLFFLWHSRFRSEPRSFIWEKTCVSPTSNSETTAIPRQNTCSFIFSVDWSCDADAKVRGSKVLESRGGLKIQAFSSQMFGYWNWQ